MTSSPHYLSAQNLSLCQGVSHAFFTRAGGNGGFSVPVKGDAALVIEQGRSRMATHLGIKASHMLSCNQIHSSTVVHVDELWSDTNRPSADALVTTKQNIALTVLTADCVPVLIADETARVIGAAHAGWKGALGGVLENTLFLMENLGAKSSRCKAALGPCIFQKSYEVSEAFADVFIKSNESNYLYFGPSLRSGHLMFDLPGYVMAKLQELGVGSVAPPFADTYSNPDLFYSHRYSTHCGEERAGSLLSAIMLS